MNIWLQQFFRKTCDGACTKPHSESGQRKKSSPKAEPECDDFYMDTKTVLGVDFPQKYFLDNKENPEECNTSSDSGYKNKNEESGETDQGGHSEACDKIESSKSAAPTPTVDNQVSDVPGSGGSWPKRGRHRRRRRVFHIPPPPPEHEFDDLSSEVSYSSCVSESNAMEYSYSYYGWLDQPFGKPLECRSQDSKVEIYITIVIISGLMMGHTLLWFLTRVYDQHAFVYLADSWSLNPIWSWSACCSG